MVSEKILGKADDPEFADCEIDYVDIEWHEAFKKLHRKTTCRGEEIGIRMDNGVLTKGLNQGDVLAKEGKRIVVVNIPPCEVIRVQVDVHHPHMLGKVCYEIGNRHAALFWGDTGEEVITPYNEPMLAMLEKLHGVTVCRDTARLDFAKSIASSINNHTH